jgi:hypothetical protein
VESNFLNTVASLEGHVDEDEEENCECELIHRQYLSSVKESIRKIG